MFSLSSLRLPACTSQYTMATTGKVVALLCLGVLMALALEMMAHPANASNMKVYSGPGCSGNSITLNVCGCNNIPPGDNGGYSWTYTTQTGAAYNSQECTGASQVQFGSPSISRCSPFEWHSFFIQCWICISLDEDVAGRTWSMSSYWIGSWINSYYHNSIAISDPNSWSGVMWMSTGYNGLCQSWPCLE
jgi:hypothetical protein